ncbi:MAG: DUF1330 domain-containing protein [Lachnospiraceae bacterium]
MFYFIVSIYSSRTKEKREYEDYIKSVKPIVEKYGGRYLVRSDKITALQKEWQPERVIVIEWDTKERLEACFSSKEYREIAAKRENSVDSRAIIVEG